MHKMLMTKKAPLSLVPAADCALYGALLGRTLKRYKVKQGASGTHNLVFQSEPMYVSSVAGSSAMKGRPYATKDQERATRRGARSHHQASLTRAASPRRTNRSRTLSYTRLYTYV